MAAKVIKFGGSSLADAIQFEKVKKIILADEQRVYVVPSAPGKRSYKDEKVTDMLYTCAKLVEDGKDFEDVFSLIMERYIDIAFDLNLKIDIMSYLTEVQAKIADNAGSDYAASRGEYLNGLLLADYLGFEFIDPAQMIRFNVEGEFDSQTTQQLILKHMKNIKKAVIPGFYGAFSDGRIKTFSRGGSDITGAIIAQGVSAELYENWTDVSGLLMADPRVVKNPRSIRTVTYSELRELSYMGASVLHDESIFPVRQACIPINVKNTNAPDDEGTMIVAQADENSKEFITGIAGRTGFTVISLAKDKMNNEIGFAASVLNVLRDHKISVEHMPTGIDTISFIIEDSFLEGKRQQVLDDIIAKSNPDSLETHDKMALLAVVGRNMLGRVGTSALIFSALSEAHVNVRMIDQGSSEMNIIIGVESESLGDAMNAIYNAVLHK